MYEELAKSLRQCAEASCAGCKNDLVKIGCRGMLQREAADAIEQLEKDVERAKEWASFWEEEATEALKKFQVAVASKPRWIPVTERLPNENDDVLIYGAWTGRSGAEYREIWLTDLKGFIHQGYKPLTWMPLPEPPKEET